MPHVLRPQTKEKGESELGLSTDLSDSWLWRSDQLPHDSPHPQTAGLNSLSLSFFSEIFYHRIEKSNWNTWCLRSQVMDKMNMWLRLVNRSQVSQLSLWIVVDEVWHSEIFIPENPCSGEETRGAKRKVNCGGCRIKILSQLIMANIPITEPLTD